MSSQKYDKCFNFLSNEDKHSLLFVCLKKDSDSAVRGLDIFDEFFHFYNSGNWEAVASLKKDAYAEDWVLINSNFQTKIQDPEKQLKNISTVSLENCEVQPNGRNGKHLSCTNEVEITEDYDSISWNLKEFQD